jgi:uncharacterized protein (DUF1015 family)
MPEIKAFKGIRYNLEKLTNLADVICQPYDQLTGRNLQLTKPNI